VVGSGIKLLGVTFHSSLSSFICLFIYLMLSIHGSFSCIFDHLIPFSFVAFVLILGLFIHSHFIHLSSFMVGLVKIVLGGHTSC
jgi:hypothetical protein